MMTNTYYSQILWENPDLKQLEGDPYARGAVPSRISLFVEEDQVSVVESHSIYFRPAAQRSIAGEEWPFPWRRYQTKNKVVFSFRSGALRIYTLSRWKGTRWHIKDTTKFPAYPNMTYGYTFQGGNMVDIHGARALLIGEIHACAARHGIAPPLDGEDSNFEKTCMWYAFAAMRQIPWDTIPFVIDGDLKPWRESDPKALVAGLFGTYTKAHMRTLNEWLNDYGYALPSMLQQVRVLKGLVPHEWLDNLETQEHFPSTDQVKDVNRWLRHLLKRVTPKRAMSFFLQEEWLQLDILRMYYSLRGKVELPRRQFTWRELHDDMALAVAKVDFPLEDIPQIPAAKKIDGLKVNEFTLVTPKTNHEVIAWGQIMHHCIGSYSQQAVRGTTLLYAVMKGSTIVATGQIDCSTRYTPNGDRMDERHIVQMLGTHNAYMPAEQYDAIYEALIKADVIDPASDKGWGSGGPREEFVHPHADQLAIPAPVSRPGGQYDPFDEEPF